MLLLLLYGVGKKIICFQWIKEGMNTCSNSKAMSEIDSHKAIPVVKSVLPCRNMTQSCHHNAYKTIKSSFQSNLSLERLSRKSFQKFQLNLQMDERGRKGVPIFYLGWLTEYPFCHNSHRSFPGFVGLKESKKFRFSFFDLVWGNFERCYPKP